MPQRRDPKTSPKAFLGKRLRLARIAAGFSSQDALAARLGFDRSVVAKAETGDRPPTSDVLTAWCEACGLDADLFADLAELARSGDGPVPTWFEDYLEAEREAHTLRIWSLVLVPGLLQTAGYARALFVAAGVDGDTADEMASARLERQAIHDRPDPPHVVVMLDESVLHRLIGTPQVMADVLTHMAELSDRTNVSIQILPEDTGANAGLSGAFDIASADGAPDVLRMDGVEDVTTENRSLVRKAAIIFDRVRAEALPRAASRTRILEAAEQWKTR
jgi:transcriptional regulator with XRE-family HTH domain